MADTPAMPATACCRKCYYPLAGAAAGRCPECGREFDPGDAKTYLRRAPSRWRWVRRITGTLLLVGFLVAFAPRGWVVITFNLNDSPAAGTETVRRALLSPSWLSSVPYPWWTTTRALPADEIAAMDSRLAASYYKSPGGRLPLAAYIRVDAHRWGQSTSQFQGPFFADYFEVLAIDKHRCDRDNLDSTLEYVQRMESEKQLQGVSFGPAPAASP